MFHNDDVVEEIATKRQGVVDSIGTSQTGSQTQQNSWRVRFNDGKEPLFRYLTDEAELRLVQCRHQGEGEAGFYPSSSIMD
jgi:hypothetical protein